MVRSLRLVFAGMLVLMLFGFAPTFAQSFFGYSRVYLPNVVSAPQPTPKPSAPRIVAWLDIPPKVGINDYMPIVVHIQNQSRTAFTGKTQVTLPYQGRLFYAVSTSFTTGKGDWLKQNQYPTQLVMEFGALGAGEDRQGTIYYDFRANGANAQIGDKLQISATYTNGRPECGSDTCATNKGTVEVVSSSPSGGGQLPNGTQQVQKIGTLPYGQFYRWVPAGFRPGEQVVTWLNIAGGGVVPLTFQQQADSSGKAYFNVDVAGLSNGFYSIVAHGKDTQIEIIGEFQVVNSPLSSATGVSEHPVLVTLPAPPAETEPRAAMIAQPTQATGNAALAGVVAAAGTNGATRLEGVHVTVLGADGSAVGTTTTDSNGGYVLTGLPAGTYTASFDPHFSLSDSARRFQPHTQASVQLPSTTRLDAELTAGSQVSGRVTGAGTGGLADVSVLLLNGSTLVEATTTSDDGRYLLDGIPSGTYSLRFDPSKARDDLVQSFAITTSATFSLTAPEPRGNQDVVLNRSLDRGLIAGQVAAADTGAPLADVFVAFQHLDAESGQFVYDSLALTDATGAYNAALPVGTYRVSFLPSFSTDPTSARYLNEYFNDVRDPASATSLTVAAGATTRADAALALGGAIVGTVTGAGQALAGVVVLAYATSTNALVDVSLSDETGAYALTGVPAGSYRVAFAPYLSTNPTTRAFASVTRNDPVTVAAGGSANNGTVDLALGGTIRGTVKNSNGGALAGVLVVAIDPRNLADPTDDALVGLGLSDATGAYSVPGLATGSYTLLFETKLASAPDVAAYLHATVTGVSVSSGGTTDGINATLTQGGQIRGEVRDAAGGFTVSGVLVEIAATTDPNTPVAFAITGEDGAYASTALTPGQSYLVHFDPRLRAGETRYKAEYFDNAPDLTTAKPVSVPDTTPVTGINAALEVAP